MGALELGAVADGSAELDDGGLVGDLLGLNNGVVDGLEVIVTIIDGLDVPVIRLEALGNILGERDVGVTIDGDIWRRKCEFRP